MSKILDLNKNSNKGFSFKNKSPQKAEILIYGTIGEDWFGNSISAKEFSEKLAALDPNTSEIEVRLNSPGGDVFEGWAIYNRLKQHKAKVTVHIDGMAASIASIIMLAGDEIIAGEGAQIMIHRAWTGSYGNAGDFENIIDRLNTIDEQLITSYAKKTKKSRSEIKDAVYAETWFTSDEAKEFGLVDSISGDTLAIAASVLNSASWIKKMPKNLATDTKVAKAKAINIKDKIEGFLKARK